jgi:two-component system invasion response regulator UvrY
LRIVIADHHMIIRRGMQLIVAKRPGWTIAAEAATAEELFDLLRREHYDVVVLDLTLRDRSGIDVVAQIRREHPGLPVLILASQPEEQYALHCLRVGARGYVQKDSSADDILGAIERVAAGRTWVSAEVTEQMAAELLHPSDKAPHQLLSPREFEVFRLIALGRTMTEIAAALSLSVKTASTYRARILAKTGFHGNADIVAYAIRAQLI